MGDNLTTKQEQQVDELDGWQVASYWHARDLGASHDEAMRLALDTTEMEKFLERMYA